MPTDPIPQTTPTGTDPRVAAALNVTTPDTPESVQYVLIRGLHAMGYAQPTAESWALMAAALEAADGKR